MLRWITDVFGILVVGGLSQYVIRKLPRSLADNALTSYIDNKIGAAAGLTEAQVDGFLLEWFVPLLLGVAALLAWHWLAALQYRRTSPVDYAGMVDEAFQGLGSNEIDWLRKNHIGGRPNNGDIAEALFAARLIERDFTGFTGVIEHLKPIIAQKLKTLDRRTAIHRLGSKLEPSHIVMLGLFIAVSGVIWQVLQPKPTTTTTINAETAKTEFDVFSGKQFVPEKTINKPPSTKRYYSNADKEEISAAFARVSAALNKPTAAIERESQQLAQLWEAKKYSTTPPQADLKYITDRLEALRPVSSEAYQGIESVIRDFPRRAELLAEVLLLPATEREQPIPNWQYASNDLHRAISTFSEIYDKVDGRAREGFVVTANPIQTNFSNATAKLNDWIHQSNLRLKAQEKEIFQ